METDKNKLEMIKLSDAFINVFITSFEVMFK